MIAGSQLNQPASCSAYGVISSLFMAPCLYMLEPEPAAKWLAEVAYIGHSALSALLLCADGWRQACMATAAAGSPWPRKAQDCLLCKVKNFTLDSTMPTHKSRMSASLLQRSNAHITRFKSSKSNHDGQLPQGPGCYPHLKHRGKRKVDRNQLDRSHNQHHHPHHIMV